ncbi:SDR family NAD(P)-dependent oxidoreductase [Nitratireductor sp. XY-223]|uniref:SDR family NAD(P)-dependent oxidoreductase n=1 Tax=Nitratireductor sp. XY-223 TaxID=2561926 RepID=UPI0010AB3707|nr:SDR family NAD(P)-dependent oxidoreductase [Nitratireductor sp. XY-223]
MTHPAFNSESVAVVTGGASGIGLASATNFAGMGMRLVIVDRAEDKLAEAESALRSAGAADVMTAATDISDRAEVEALESEVATRFGGTDILMNNAGIGMRSSCLGPLDAWQSTLDVNLWGAVHGTQVFAPRMIARGRPGAIVNTGSKQGITTPPGNPAYNVSKAALKAFTEALAHELRNTDDCRISAHLLIPGFVHTGMIGLAEKPPAAWTAGQTADFFVESMARGDFYIICPDNDVPRALDEKRIAWAMGDMIENRPALSRWHPDYAEAYAAFIDGDR